MKRLNLIGKTLFLLLFVCAPAMAQQTVSENAAPAQEIDELDIMITIVNEDDQSTVIDEVISLPSVASQKAVKKNTNKRQDKTNNASNKARSNAQQRIKNILGDSVPDNASERLPSDIRRVIPPKKPPKPPKPKAK